MGKSLMEILWCPNCYTIFEKKKLCSFCQKQLHLLARTKYQNGCWMVFCSRDGRLSRAQTLQILGRDNPYTRHLLNDFISREHAKISAGEETIILEDMGSSNGTFIRKSQEKDLDIASGSWLRLEKENTLSLSSGTWLLLSKECLLQLWLKWIPRRITLEESTHFKKAKGTIDLSQETSELDDVRFFTIDNEPFIEVEIGKTGVINDRFTPVAQLFDGDYVTLSGQQYQYYSQMLVPASPISFCHITITELFLKNRLKIKELALEGKNFIGIIGASGSGKSTLIKILTGWIELPKDTLGIQVAGRSVSMKDFKKQTSYVPQYDIVYENITTQYSLLYKSLIQDNKTPIPELLEKVQHILAQTKMLLHQDKDVKYLSGGQRKRVNIANALLQENSLMLILDEPTSGLDMRNDHNIMGLLKRISEQGRTVICSTHNLGSIHFFDNVIHLTDGRIKTKGTPEEILYDNDITIENQNIDYQQIYASKEERVISTEQLKTPWFLKMCRSQWWILLIRRFDDFRPFPLSLLIFIPLFIGLTIYIAWPEASNLYDKRFFLCNVAIFWLGMSIASREFSKKRYQIFLHEKLSTVRIFPFFSLMFFFIFLSIFSKHLF